MYTPSANDAQQITLFTFRSVNGDWEPFTFRQTFFRQQDAVRYLCVFGANFNLAIVRAYAVKDCTSDIGDVPKWKNLTISQWCIRYHRPMTDEHRWLYYVYYKSRVFVIRIRRHHTQRCIIFVVRREASILIPIFHAD